MKHFLELIRITLIFLILGAIIGGSVKFVYNNIGVDIDNTFGAGLVGVSIFLLIFVLYRNKIQFTGFYKNSGRVKLSKPYSVLLICCSVLLLILTPFFN